jgi:hypothetical protein
MSFYTCNRTGNIPGVITGNPLNGICEKACIQTNKVLDACMKQLQETNLQLVLTDQTPADPVLPLTFVSATTATGTTITNLVVDRLIDRPNFARVSGSVNIPLVVTYTDANGTAGEGNTTINVPFDVIMFIPQPSVVPYTIEAFGAASVPSGVYVSGSTFSISACITIILRVIVRAELLVPSYGYCQAPACQD